MLMVIDGGRQEPTPMTLWEAVIWTYRDQRAHHFLRRPMDWFLWAIADAGLIEDGPRRKVHPDAATLYGEVLELGQERAELIAYHADMAMQPEPPVTMPTPFPTTPDRAGYSLSTKDQRWSWAVIDGARQDYLIITHETITLQDKVFERIGRKGMRDTGRTTAKPFAVEYCPVAWLPDMAWVRNEAAMHRDWVLAMAALYDRLEAVRLKDHAIGELGFAAEYIDVEAPLVTDARTVELNGIFPRRRIGVDTRSEAVSLSSDQQILYGVRARAARC
jgi:hypothetical protein